MKKTVNLPPTEFSMKANLPESEPKMLARWEEQKLCGRIREARAGRLPEEVMGKTVWEANRVVVELLRAWGQERIANMIGPAAELLSSEARCGKCLSSEFRKETDILDVWFDSGASHLATLTEANGLPWSSDLYIEGGDQYRGWFHSSLLVGVGQRGRSPYRQCATRGWTLDSEGRAIWKSLGNCVYTAAPRSRSRRSAQTALCRLTLALVRLLAPLLTFTTDEGWGHLNASAAGSTRSKWGPIRSGLAFARPASRRSRRS